MRAQRRFAARPNPQANLFELETVARDPTPKLSHARSKSRSRRASPTPAPRPWHCVILAIDPGNRCGWSIWISGKFLMSGEHNSIDADKCADIVTLAIGAARERKLPCVLVCEWSAWGDARTAAGLAATVERWKIPWRAADGGNRARFVKVNVRTWRSRVLGEGFGGNVANDMVLAVERAKARAIVLAQEPERESSIGTNESPAVLIGMWGSYAGEVGKRLPDKVRKLSLAS